MSVCENILLLDNNHNPQCAIGIVDARTHVNDALKVRRLDTTGKPRVSVGRNNIPV